MKLGRRENILPLCFTFVLDYAARGRIRRHRWSAVGGWQEVKFYPHSSYVLALAAGGFRRVFRYSTPPLAVSPLLPLPQMEGGERRDVAEGADQY